jgi:hypothetical protein
MRELAASVNLDAVEKELKNARIGNGRLKHTEAFLPPRR